MAKDTVFIDIQTSDGGSMQKVAVSAKKLGIALDDAGVATSKLGKSARTVDRNLKGTANMTSNSTKQFSKMSQGITGGLVPAYAVLASNVFAITAAFQFLRQAADFRVTQDSQLAFTAATGVGMQTLTRNIQAASGEMLNFQAASEAASIGIASGLGSGQIESLAAGAGNLSKILGRDVTDSFNRLVRGVTKAEPELLDELGITLRLADATETYAAKLGKRADELTKFERKQAVFNDVQDQLEEKFNRVSKVTDVQANSIARLGVAFDSVLKHIKRYTNAISEPAAEFFTRNIQSLSVAMAFLAVPIVKSIIPGLNDFAQNSREAADEASAAFEQTTREMKELEAQAKKIEALEGGPGKAVQSIMPKTGGGKGGDALRRGETLQGKQLSAALRDAKLNRGVITKMSADNQKIYRASLEAMKNDTKGFADNAALQFEKAANAADRSAKRMELRMKKASSVITGAFAAMGKGINLIFKGLGLIGLGLLLKDLGIELGRFLGLLSDSRAINLIEEDANNLISSVQTLNDEFAKFNAVQKEMGTNTLSSFEAIGRRVELSNQKLRESVDLLREMRDMEFAAERRGVEEFTQANADALAELKKQRDAIPQTMAAQLTAPGQGFLQGVGGAMLMGQLSQTPQGLDMLYGQKAQTEEAKKALAELTQQIEALEQKQSDYNTFRKKFDDGFKQTEALAKGVSRTFADLTVYFVGLTRPLTEAEQKYKNVLDRIDKQRQEGKDIGEILSKEDVRILLEAGDKIAEFGAFAADTKRAYNDLSASYREQISGITQYQTSVSNLIRDLGELKDAELKIKATGYEDRIDQANEYLRVLNLVHQAEIGNATALLMAEAKLTRESIGRSSIELAVIDRQRKINKLAKDLQDIQDKIDLGKDKAIKRDQELIDSLDAQKAKAEALLKLEQQRAQLAQRIFDAGYTALGTGLSQQIAAVLKGEESSIKDAVLKILKGVADAAINTLALGLAESIMASITNALSGTKLGKFFKLPGQAGFEAALAKYEVTLGDALRVQEISPQSSVVASTQDVEDKLDKVNENLTVPEGIKVHVVNTEGIALEIHKALEACICHTDTPSEKADMVKEIVEAVTPKEDTVDAATKLERVIQNFPGLITRDPTEDFRRTPAFETQSETIVTNPLTNATIRNTDATERDIVSRDISTTLITEGFAANVRDFGSTFKTGIFDMKASFRDLSRTIANMGSSEDNDTGFLMELGNALGSAYASQAAAKSGMIPKYARGGVVSGPESGFPAVLHGDEAVVPLPDGRSIPVMMKGSGAQQNNVGVTVNIDNNGRATTDTESDSQEAAILGNKLAELVREELLNQKRNGGILSPYGVA